MCVTRTCSPGRTLQGRQQPASTQTLIIAMSGSAIKLVTVNTAPERAKRLIGRVVEDVKDTYTIVHVANVERE